VNLFLHPVVILMPDIPIPAQLPPALFLRNTLKIAVHILGQKFILVQEIIFRENIVNEAAKTLLVMKIAIG